jgi:hypothetical protein
MLSCPRARAADNFGDISVGPAAMYTGKTSHGYAESLVTLENHSRVRTHNVTLVFPDKTWNSGNSISRLSRSVTLAPGARETVSLLQPPLPATGDQSIRVEIDDRTEGRVRAPNGSDHCSYYTPGNRAPTVFISRSLDFDAVERVFHTNHAEFTAAMATGPPDAGSSGGSSESQTWMPDRRRPGQSNWLELDYPPQPVDRIRIYCPTAVPRSTEIRFTGVSGTNVASVRMGSATTRATAYPGGTVQEFPVPITSEPVKTVRLDFGKAPPYNIAVDAVEISGPSGSAFASAARASSDNSAAAGGSARGVAGPDSINTLRAEAPVSEWSAHWLAYSPFDAVVLGAGDLRSMPPAVLAAIGDYLEAGGNVVLTGQADLPASWHASAKTALRDGFEHSVGFGRCFALGTDNPSALHPESIHRLRSTVREALHYWEGLPEDSRGANAALPVVDSLKIPTRGLILIMLAFVVVIGPVNILVLSRRRRRTWLLWTIPAISALTTLIVFAYSLLSEGVTPYARIAGLTLLDQASHHAVTVGGEAFYCPLTPSGGLRFDFDTEATPLVHSGWDRSGVAREVDWTQSQHFRRGWVSARVPAYFHLRKPETRRERVEVVNEGGRLRIVNGLGVGIRSIWMADAATNCFEAAGVPAGQTAGLVRSTSARAVGGAGGAGGLLRDAGFAARLDSLKGGTPTAYLLPNTYIAVLDRNPFLENALGRAASPKRTRSTAVVFGILEPSQAK